MELLSPAGSMEGLRGVLCAGADAVYMGGTRFGARAYAKNPEETQLLEAIDLCHLYGRKLYLTVNTLLKEEELKNSLYSFILPLYRQGVDAVLVQDFGVLRFLHREFPALSLHASTQMSVMSPGMASFLKRHGVTRIVPARELSLKEIAALKAESGLEIECFVHGALCYCYSGQCLMSSMIGGRSGNRGRCAQPCRLPYSLYAMGEEHNFHSRKDSSFLLSLKDIQTLSLLPDLRRAGVSSLKIEGRMKKPEYAAGVTAIYRTCLDRLRDGETDLVSEDMLRDLGDLYNRGGFSEGYYRTYHGKDMMSMQRPNHVGTTAAVFQKSERGKQKWVTQEPLYAGDVLEFLPNYGKPRKTSAGNHAETDRMEWTLQAPVSGGASLSIPDALQKKLQRERSAGNASGYTLQRTRCEMLLTTIRERYLTSLPQLEVTGAFHASAGVPCTLTVCAGDVSVCEEGSVCEKAEHAGATPAQARKQLEKTGGTPFIMRDLTVTLDLDVFLPVKELNALRRSALDHLQNAITKKYHRDAPVAGVAGCGAPPFVILEESAADSRQDTSFSFAACVETGAQARALLGIGPLSELYVDITTLQTDTLPDLLCAVHNAGKKLLLYLPAVWRERARAFYQQAVAPQMEALLDGYVLRCADQIPEFAGRLLPGQALVSDREVYAWNSEAMQFLQEAGVMRITLPAEYNAKELSTLHHAAALLRGAQTKIAQTELVVYGYTTVMKTAQCLVNNTSGCRQTPQHGLFLKDRVGAHFPVENRCCICTNLIYNSAKLDLTDCRSQIENIRPDVLRFSFTSESPQDCCQIMMAGIRRLQNPTKAFTNDRERMGEPLTREHFRRGVE